MSARAVMKTPRVALVTPDRDPPRDQLVSLLDQIRAEISASVASLKVNYRLPWTRPEKELLGRAAAELEEFLDYTLEGLQTVVAGAQDAGEAAYRARRAADVRTALADFSEELERVLKVVSEASERLVGLGSRAPLTQQAQIETTRVTLQDAAGRMGRVLRDLRGERVATRTPGFYTRGGEYLYVPTVVAGYASALNSDDGTATGRAQVDTVPLTALVNWTPVPFHQVPGEWVAWFRRAHRNRVPQLEFLDRLGGKPPSGRTAAVGKNTVTIYEIIHDIARPGPNADYTDIHRTRDKAAAERFAANHTHMGRPCQVQVAEVPKKIVQRWGI